MLFLVIEKMVKKTIKYKKIVFFMPFLWYNVIVSAGVLVLGVDANLRDLNLNFKYVSKKNRNC